MAKRYIMRIELSAETLRALPRICEKLGMTRLSLDSKLVEWAEAQDPLIRRMMLNPGVDPDDLVRTILTKMAG
jgi:hypothetical protein